MTNTNNSATGSTEDLKKEFTERAQARMTGPNPHRPTHTLYFVRDRGEEYKPAWDRVGVAWTNRDGSLSCKLDVMPLEGRFQIRSIEDDRRKGEDQGDA